MASSAREGTDGNAINQVARNCGSLAIECSDVAGYVAGVNERISRNLKMLDGLEEVTTRLMADQARGSDSTDEDRVFTPMSARDDCDEGKAPKQPVGVSWLYRLRGNFVVTAHYEILDDAPPGSGYHCDLFR